MAYLGKNKVLFAYLGNSNKVLPAHEITTSEKMEEILNNATIEQNNTVYRYIGPDTDKYINGAYYILEV